MKTPCVCAGLLLLVCCWTGTVRAEEGKDSKAAKADNAITLTGTFDWIQMKNKKFGLKVVLTPKGAGEYTAAYFFKWDKKDFTYTGTLKGDLKNGEISGTGTGMTPRGKRNWTFTGKAVDGVITCKHADTTDSKPVPTGEFSLKS